MSESFIKSTLPGSENIIGGYELVSEVIVDTATTSVEFTGLNFTIDDDLMLITDLNYVGSSERVYLDVNNTTSGYYYQRLYATGTTVGASRGADNWFHFTGTEQVSAIMNIKLTNNGYCTYQISKSYYGGDTVQVHSIDMTSTFTISTITSLRIRGELSNVIAAGSRFQLYKRTAEVVADIEVTSATTQVDLIGLTIDKNSEYRLVGTGINGTATATEVYMFANDNVSLSNYYYQQIYASSTAVTSERQNWPRVLYIQASRSSFGIIDIKLTNSNYFTFQSKNILNHDVASDIQLSNRYGTSTFTATSITKLSIVSSVTTGIGVGSRFQLIKFKA